MRRLATSRPLGEQSEPCLAAKRPTASDEVARGRLACSKRSDSGERCEVKKAMKSRGELGREVRFPLSPPPPSPCLAFTFSRPFLLRTAPHYLNAWNRLEVDLSRLMGFHSHFAPKMGSGVTCIWGFGFHLRVLDLNGRIRLSK